MGSLAFALHMTVIRPNPFIGYHAKPARKRAFPRYAIVVDSIFYLGFRAMSDNVAKQMKGFERKPPSRHLSLAQADTVRHKSGISLSSPGLTTLARCQNKTTSKIKSKQRRRTTVRKSLRNRPIVLGSALKSSREKSQDFVS